MANNLIASQCPVPVGPSGAYALSGCTDKETTAPNPWLPVGGSAEWPEHFDKNAASGANAAAYGGPGAYGVISGLTFGSATGLSQAVNAGYVMANGAVPVAAGSVTLSDNARNYVWVTQGGTLVATTLLTPPAGGVVCIGSVLTASGAVSSSDVSPVIYLKGGHGVRTTADLGMPGDVPSANTLFYVRTRYGLWLWTGTEYRLVSQFGQAQVDFGSDANHTLTQDEYECDLLRILDSDSHLTAARSLIFPAILTGQIRAINETDYAITLRVGTSTGVTIASGHSAAVYLDGSDVVRLSADYA